MKVLGTGGRTILPKNIDEIKRTKLKSEGVKESEFMIGSRFMMKFMEEEQLWPFLRSSDKVYQTTYNDPSTKEPFIL